MEYSPEYWQFRWETRHRVMPAMGALIMADYYDFLASDEVQAALHPDTAETTANEQLRYLDTTVINQAGFSIPIDSEPRKVLDAIFMTAANVIDAEKVHAKRQPLFGFETTPEQESWMAEGVFFDYARADERLQLRLGKSFISETRLSGVQGLKYFASALTLDRQRKRQGRPYDTEHLFQALLSQGFIADMRRAAAAPQLHWSTPDSDKSMWDILSSIAYKMTDPYFEDDNGPKLQFHRNRIAGRCLEEGVVQMRRLTREGRNRAADPKFYSEWAVASTSGCPVRHQSLGPNVQAAFTDEQREHIERVANIDKSGVLNYTWDPFQATVDLVIPQVKRVYEHINYTPLRGIYAY